MVSQKKMKLNHVESGYIVLVTVTQWGVSTRSDMPGVKQSGIIIIKHRSD